MDTQQKIDAIIEQNKKLENELHRIEAELLEQEHRPFKLFWNFYKRKNDWGNQNDPRFIAVTKAIIWRFFASPTTIAIASGGIIGILTLFFLYRQDNHLENQNKLLKNQNIIIELQNQKFDLQNKRIEQQTYLTEASRRSSQMFIMGEVLSDLTSELESRSNTTRTLSNSLIGRINGLTLSMKPYRYLSGDSLIATSLSPERAQLLISLVESKIDSLHIVDFIFEKSNFNYSDLNEVVFNDVILTKANLAFSDLRNASIFSSNMSRTKLENASLFNANIVMSYLDSVNLKETNLDEVHFGATRLRGIDLENHALFGVQFEYCTLDGSNLNGAKFDNVLFLETSIKHSDLRGAILKDCNIATPEFLDLSHSNISGTNFSGTNISNIILDSTLVNRPDWFIYQRDSLGVEGIDRIIYDYKIVDAPKNKYFEDYIIVKDY